VVTRASVDGAPGLVEEYAAGDVVVLNIGDSMVEEGGVYLLENPNAEAAILNFAALVEKGAPMTSYTEH
jgi:hypothetical protein